MKYPNTAPYEQRVDEHIFREFSLGELEAAARIALQSRTLYTRGNRFLVSTKTLMQYKEKVAERIATGPLLRKFNESVAPVTYAGIPLVVWPGVPEGTIVITSRIKENSNES